MAGQLIISDEVREQVPSRVLERAIAMRNHTEILCAYCGGRVPPESRKPLTVVVRFGDDGRGVVNYAHPQCSPSIIDRRTRPRPQRHDVSYIAYLRPHHPIAGILIWEPTQVDIDAGSGEAFVVTVAQKFGFRPSERGMGDTSGPFLDDGWLLRLSQRDAVLNSPHGVLNTFGDIKATAPPGWRQALRDSGRCLLIVGEALGLDRPSPERIDALLADGRALAAVVRTDVARR